MPTQVAEWSDPLRRLEKTEKQLQPYGGVAQLGEHLPCKQGVMGSNPIISTSAQSAQWKIENGEWKINFQLSIFNFQLQVNNHFN